MTRALLLAPLAGPFAVFIAALIRAVLASTPFGSLAGVSVGFFIFLLFGAPPAYVATLIVLWPVARALLGAGRFHWLAITAVSTVGGGVLMPLYLYLLEPRGSITIFPGAGFIAGAAVGLAFWWLASRPEPSATPD